MKNHGGVGRMRKPAALKTNNVIQEVDQKEEVTPLPKEMSSKFAGYRMEESKRQKSPVTQIDSNHLPTIDSSMAYKEQIRPKVAESTKVSRVKMHSKSNMSFNESNKKKQGVPSDKVKRNNMNDKFISAQNLSYLSNQKKKGVPNKLVYSPYLDEF